MVSFTIGYKFHLENFARKRLLKEYFTQIETYQLGYHHVELYSSPFIYMKKSSMNIPLNFTIVFQWSHMVLERHECEVNDDRFFMSGWTIRLNLSLSFQWWHLQSLFLPPCSWIFFLHVPCHSLFVTQMLRKCHMGYFLCPQSALLAELRFKPEKKKRKKKTPHGSKYKFLVHTSTCRYHYPSTLLEINSR